MSVGEVLTRALSDTLMGMGTVFLILIIISLVISLFKFIPKAEKEHKTVTDKTRDKEQTASRAVKNVVTDSEEDDDEIIAVILAAIRMAKEREAQITGDVSGEAYAEPSYVVRSITRRR